jgi:hypothetical protein
MIIGLLFSPSYKLAGRDQTHLGPGIRYTCFGDPWFILCGGTLDRANRVHFLLQHSDVDFFREIIIANQN